MKKILFILLLPLTLFGQSQKISDMTSATTLAGTEYVPIVQTTNKKATVSLLRGFGSYGTAGQYMTVNGSANGFTFVTPPFISSVGTGVANELTYWSGTNTLGSLATATYPSLTELSYVKGITSAIQTQLNAKGVGDMLLGSAQTNTGTKTFLDGSFKLRNVANTFDAIFSNNNTANRTYTLPNASGTVALTSDLSGWLTGTLTGNTSIDASTNNFDISNLTNFSIFEKDGKFSIYGSGDQFSFGASDNIDNSGGLYVDVTNNYASLSYAGIVGLANSYSNVYTREDSTSLEWINAGIDSSYVSASDHVQIYGSNGIRLGLSSTDNYVWTAQGTDGSGAWEPSASGGGDVTKVGTPVDNQIGVWTGDGTIEGTTGLTYNGSNLQLTGDIGSTGTRITKGWFTDLQVTNAIAGSITGNAATVTTNANLTGHITSTGNAAVLGSFTVAQLSTAISDANISGTNTGDQTSIVGITGSLAEFNTALTGADFASGGGTATGTNTGDQALANTSDATSHTVTLTGGTSVQLIEGSNITLTTGGTGGAGTVTIAASGGGGSSALDDITAATGANSIDNLNNAQTWNWNTLTANGISFLSNTTAAVSGQNIFYTKLEGANASSSIISRASYHENLHTGTGSINIAQTLNAAGGSTNIALEVLGGRIDLSDGVDITLGNTTGTKIGTSTSSKLGFYNATPVVRQSAVTTVQGIADALTAYGLLPSSTISGGGSGLTYAQSKALSHKFR